MQTPRLIYFADPMCSWCYGFSPVIAQIRQTFGRALPIEVVMGGLRPGNAGPRLRIPDLRAPCHGRPAARGNFRPAPAPGAA